METRRDSRSERHLIATRTVMSLFSALRSFTPEPELSLILLVVAWGHMEGRPMDITGLGHFMGTSRTSMMRRLRRLEDVGMIEMQSRGMRRIPKPVGARVEKFLDDVAKRLSV